MVKADLFVDMSKVKLADGCLELCQFSRLLQLIRERNFKAVAKHIADGVPQIIDYVHPEYAGETALGLAASVNDDEMIRHLLTLGAETDVYDLKGRSAAMRAAEMGHVQSMFVLAENGLDMKIVDESGKGILFYCIGQTKRHTECGDIALHHGADVSNRTRQGTPILMFACETSKDNEDFIESLLRAGADPRLADQESNRTALIAAASSGSARVVRALLTVANNVDEVMSRTRVHALHEAAKNGHTEAIKVMAGFGANFDQCTDKAYSNAETPIHMAAANGKDNCIIFLASRGCNALAKNKENKTARAVAKERGDKPVIKACKKAEKMTKTKKKPPLWAIQLHDFCFIHDIQLTAAFRDLDVDNSRAVNVADFNKVLADMGAPIPELADLWNTVLANHEGGGKDTVLYNVFLGGRKLLPKKYLMSSFEPKYKKPKNPKKMKVKGWPMPVPTLTAEAVDPDTYVPLHYDVTDLGRFNRDRPPVHPFENDTAWYTAQPLETTIQLNIALHQTDRNTVRDAVYFPEFTTEGTVYEPVNHEPPPEPTSPEPPVDTDAPPPSTIPRVRPPPPVWQVPMLGDKAQINLRSSTMKTPLMVACSMGHLELVKMMVEAGANVNQKDNFYWTALHHAAHSGTVSVADYLLAHGAKMEAVAINGTTPLTRAVESCCPEMVDFLIKKGAKVRVENRCEMTPLDVAACYADYEVWNIIKTKEDSMPPIKGQKKKQKKKAKKAGKPPPVPKPTPPPRPIDLLPPLKTPLRPDAAAILSNQQMRSDNDTVENITFEPTHVWTKLMTSENLIAERRERRNLYGWGIDFEDYRTPFQKNIEKKLANVAAVEAAAAAYKLKTGKRK